MMCDSQRMEKYTLDRASDRRPLSLMVKGRVHSRAVYVDLIDISEGGCKVRGSRGFANVGDTLTMKVGNINTPLGRIAWIDDKLAGIAFEGTLHPAVLDHLCAEGGEVTSPEKQRLHRL